MFHKKITSLRQSNQSAEVSTAGGEFVCLNWQLPLSTGTWPCRLAVVSIACICCAESGCARKVKSMIKKPRFLGYEEPSSWMVQPTGITESCR